MAGGLSFRFLIFFSFSVLDQVVDIQTTLIDSKFQLLSEAKYYFGFEFSRIFGSNFGLDFDTVFVVNLCERTKRGSSSIL